MYIPDSIKVFNEVLILAEKDLDQSGVKIIKIDSLLLQNKITSDLSSLLSENTPIFIKSYGRGSLSTASFRGTNASHTKVVWNNVSLNSPMLGMVDMSQIPVAITDNVVLYHGSASLSKNANAIGGLVELSNKAEWKKGIRGKYVSSIGSFNTYDNILEIKVGNNKIQSVTRAYSNYSENNFSFINGDIMEGDTELRNNADYRKKGISQEFYFRTSETSTASIKAWYQKSDRGVPGLTTNESGINNNINRQNGDMLIYSGEFLKFGEKYKLEISHGANYQKFIYNSRNYINGIGFLPVLNAQSSSFSTYNSAIYKYKLSEKTELSARANFNFHSVNSIEQIRNESYDTSRNEGGITLSAYTRITKKLRLGVLVRQDFYDFKVSPFIPSIYSEYYITNNLSFKTSAARNYNLPGLNDLYFSPGGNPSLRPEKGVSIDGGFQNVIKNAKFISQSEISFNYSNINDWIMWRPTSAGYWTPENIDRVVAYGFDCNINFKYMLGDFYLTNNANYAYTCSENMSQPSIVNDISFGKQLPYIPIHSANIFSRIEIKNFYLSHQWNYYSERYTTSAAEPGILVSIYPYFMNDIAFGKFFGFKNMVFDINFRIYNIFNESYRSVLWQPMPGRNYSLQLTIKFK